MQETQTWTGVVRRGRTRAKSMDAWNGADHVLETDDTSERIILRASDTVSAADLDALVDQHVTIHGETLPDRPVIIDADDPRQMMQFPVGGPLSLDGEISRQPAPRAGGVSVLRIDIHG